MILLGARGAMDTKLSTAVSFLLLLAPVAVRSDCTCTKSNEGIDFESGAFSDSSLFPPDTYGKTCGTWEKANCAKMWPESETFGDWCCQYWCYVDKSCETAIQSSMNPELYYAYDVCNKEDSDYKATAEEDAFCPWSDGCKCTSNRGFPFHKAPYNDVSLFPDNYGEDECGAWDSSNCVAMWPNSTLFGDWCCESWCYVPESCPLAQKSWTGEDLYWTWKTCENDEEKVKDCKYGCECTGSNEGFPFADGFPYADRTLYSDDYGKSCNAWEAEKCDKMWPASEGLNTWCCQDWCYVDKSCPYAIPSWTEAELYFTYQSCADQEDVMKQCKWTDYDGYYTEEKKAPSKENMPSVIAEGYECPWYPLTEAKATFNVTAQGISLAQTYIAAFVRSKDVKINSLKIVTATGKTVFDSATAGEKAYTGVHGETITTGLNFPVSLSTEAAAPSATPSAGRRRLLKSRGGSRGGSRSSSRSSSSRSSSRSYSSSYSSRSSPSYSYSSSYSYSGSSSRSPSYSYSRSPSYSYSRTPSSRGGTPNYPTPSTPAPKYQTYSTPYGANSYARPTQPYQVPRYSMSNSYSASYLGSGSSAATKNKYGYYKPAQSKMSALRPGSTYAAAAVGGLVGAGVVYYAMSSYANSLRYRYGYGMPVDRTYYPGQYGMNWYTDDNMYMNDYGFSGRYYRSGNRRYPYNNRYGRYHRHNDCPNFENRDRWHLDGEYCRMRYEACERNLDRNNCQGVLDLVEPSAEDVQALRLYSELTNVTRCLANAKDSSDDDVICELEIHGAMTFDALFGIGTFNMSAYAYSDFPMSVTVEHTSAASSSDPYAGIDPYLFFTFKSAAQIDFEPDGWEQTSLEQPQGGPVYNGAGNSLSPIGLLFVVIQVAVIAIVGI